MITKTSRNKGLSLGSTPHVSKTGKYQAVFYDSSSRKYSHLGFYDTKEEAQKVVDDYVFDYYSERNYLLPKGITLFAADRTYRYRLNINGKYVSVGHSKNLKGILKIRLDFITSLL